MFCMRWMTTNTSPNLHPPGWVPILEVPHQGSFFDQLRRSLDCLTLATRGDWKLCKAKSFLKHTKSQKLPMVEDENSGSTPSYSKKPRHVIVTEHPIAPRGNSRTVELSNFDKKPRDGSCTVPAAPCREHQRDGKR